MTSAAKYTDQSARRRLRREVPSAAAVLADEQDFRAMSRYRTFPFDDHRSYLQQMENLLRTLASQGVLTTLSLFDPVAFEKYCADLTLDPDRPDSRSRYTAEVARTGATLTYQGEPLNRLLPLLVEEADRQATWDHASAVLARVSDCPGAAKTSPTPRSPAPPKPSNSSSKPSAAAPTTSSAPSRPEIRPCWRCCMPPPRRAPATGSPNRTPSSSARSSPAGFALRTPGGIVSRTTPGHDTTGGPAHDTVRGWSFRDAWPRALSAAEVFTAYCTDADTGEPIPPEHGVDYAPGLPLTPPPDPHHHG